MSKRPRQQRSEKDESFTVSVCLNLQCSAECGIGVRTRAVVCLTNQVSSLPLEGCGSERPATSQVCNNGHCEQRIEWFTGPWSQVRTGRLQGHAGLERIWSGSAGHVKHYSEFIWTFEDLFHSSFLLLLHRIIKSMRPV